MLKNLTLVAALALAFGQSAQAGFDIGGMMSAGADLAKAATLSDGEIKSVAAGASKEMDSANRVAPASSAYGQRLAKLTNGMKVENAPKLKFKVYIKNEVNAFAMADGTVRIYSGLMDKLTDDEVRYVVGHEVGHVSLGHSKKALQTAYAASGVRKVGAASGNGNVSALSGSVLGGIAEKLVNAQFSQSQESDADMYALKLMKANRYDPKAAVSALRKLEKMYGNSRSAFSSHPAPGDRADALEKAT